MPFESGKPRPQKAGRKRNTPNKRTLVLADRLAECGIDPVDILNGEFPKLTADKKVDIAMKLMPYLYPQRKAVETTVTGSLEHGPTPDAMQVMEQLKAIVEMEAQQKSNGKEANDQTK